MNDQSAQEEQQLFIFKKQYESKSTNSSGLYDFYKDELLDSSIFHHTLEKLREDVDDSKKNCSKDLVRKFKFTSKKEEASNYNIPSMDLNVDYDCEANVEDEAKYLNICFEKFFNLYFYIRFKVLFYPLHSKYYSDKLSFKTTLPFKLKNTSLNNLDFFTVKCEANDIYSFLLKKTISKKLKDSVCKLTRWMEMFPSLIDDPLDTFSFEHEFDNDEEDYPIDKYWFYESEDFNREKMRCSPSCTSCVKKSSICLNFYDYNNFISRYDTPYVDDTNYFAAKIIEFNKKNNIIDEDFYESYKNKSTTKDRCVFDNRFINENKDFNTRRSMIIAYDKALLLYLEKIKSFTNNNKSINVEQMLHYECSIWLRHLQNLNGEDGFFSCEFTHTELIKYIFSECSLWCEELLSNQLRSNKSMLINNDYLSLIILYFLKLDQYPNMTEMSVYLEQFKFPYKYDSSNVTKTYKLKSDWPEIELTNIKPLNIN